MKLSITKVLFLFLALFTGNQVLRAQCDYKHTPHSGIPVASPTTGDTAFVLCVFPGQYVSFEVVKGYRYQISACNNVNEYNGVLDIYRTDSTFLKTSENTSCLNGMPTLVNQANRNETWHIALSSHGLSNCDNTVGGCTILEITIVDICSFPDDVVVSATEDTICPNGSNNTTLSTTGYSLNGSANWVWYKDACGGTQISTANEITIKPNVPTTYYVRGEGGCVENKADCSVKTVYIGDEIKPLITCLGNQVVAVNENCETVLDDYLSTASVSDNCTPAIDIVKTQTPNAGAIITSDTEVVLTATDDSGNKATCKFMVSVSDTTKPGITCPANQLGYFTADCEVFLQDYRGLATSTDNCFSPTLEQSPVAGTVITENTLVTITATDDSLNTNACSFAVTVKDTIRPEVNCPSNKTVALQSNCAYVVGNYILELTVSDNCSGAITVKQTPSAGSTITENTIINFEVSDESSNKSYCSFMLKVEDVEAPIITKCVSDTLLFVNNHCKNELPNFTSLLEFTDSCMNSVTVSQLPAIGTNVSQTTSVTLTATDGNGNNSSCSFNLFLKDTLAPTIKCPSKQTVYRRVDCSATLPNFKSLASITDNCSGATVVQSPFEGTEVSNNLMVVLTVTDTAGYQTQCSFLVELKDTVPPTVSCPVNKTVEPDANCGFILPNYTGELIANDNCSPTVSKKQSPLAGTLIDKNTLVTLTAIDQSGNETSCTFEVKLKDQVAPTVSCSGDKLASFNENCAYILPDFRNNVSVSDNCINSVVLAQNPAPNTEVYSNAIISFTAIDAGGNTATCSFNLILEDKLKPELNAPQIDTVSIDHNCIAYVPNYALKLQYSDNCSEKENILFTQNPLAGTEITNGTTVLVRVEDENGNFQAKTFNAVPKDLTAPVFVCANDTAVSPTGNCLYTLPDFRNRISLSDNCSLFLIVSQSPAIGTNVSASTTIVFSSTDESGNTATCSFVLEINDDTAPSIICPTNKTVAVNENCEFTLPNYTSLASTSDNCNNPIVVTQNPIAGSVINENTTLELTADDGNGNTTTCIFIITLKDTIAPQLVCPNTQTVELTPNCIAELPDFTKEVMSSDNCTSNLTLIQSPGAGTVISENTEININTVDESGNTATCKFMVEVEDNNPYTIACPGAQRESFDNNCKYELQDFTALALVQGRCAAIKTVTQSPVAGTVLFDNTTITLTANSSDGASASCSFILKLEDSTAPVFTCLNDVTLYKDENCKAFVPNFKNDVVVTDNCGDYKIEQSLQEGREFTETSSVTITVADLAGNETSCVVLVVVKDTLAPYFACPVNTGIVFNESCSAILPDFINGATAFDACDGELTISQTPLAGTLVQGNTTIIFTSSDKDGNVTSCSFGVKPEEQTPPTISCPSNKVAYLNRTCEYILQDFKAEAVAYDNCNTNPTITQEPEAGIVLNATTQIRLIADDENGNFDTCYFTLELKDTLAPESALPNTYVGYTNENCVYELPKFEALFPSVENCGGVSSLQTPAAGSLISTTTAIVISITDGSGNTTESAIVVSLIDTLVPVAASFTSSRTVFSNNSCQAVVPNYINEIAFTDNCSDLLLNQKPEAGTIIDEHTSVKITAIDKNENTSFCVFTVFVKDTIAPKIECTGNAVEILGESCSVTLPNYAGQVKVVEDCNPEQLNIYQLPAAGESILRDTIVTVFVEDTSGNISTCEVYVEVKDETAPYFTCLGTQQVLFGNKCYGELPNYLNDIFFNDNCNIVLVTAQTPSAGTEILVDTEVLITAEDKSGNVSTCTFIVEAIDDWHPSIICKENHKVRFSDNCDYVILNYEELILITDNCGDYTYKQTPAIGTVVKGPTNVVIQVTDNSNNVTSCDFVISPVDSTAPVLTCLNDKTVDFVNCSYTLADYSQEILVDEFCSLPITVSQTPSVGTIIFGVQEVEMSVSDANGNVSTCSFSVSPILSTTVSFTEKDSLVVYKNSKCTYKLPWLLNKVEMCAVESQEYTIEQTPIASTILSADTTITLTVYSPDLVEITSTSFALILKDTVAPKLVCIGTQKVKFDTNCRYILADYTLEISANDNCGQLQSLIQNPPAGTIITDTVKVQITATDLSRNVSTCSFNVVQKYSDNQAFVCPTSKTLMADDKCGALLPDYAVGLSTLNACKGGYSVTQEPAAGTVVSQNQNITFYAVDFQGAESTCTTEIIVVDTIKPTIVECAVWDTAYVTDDCTFLVPDVSHLVQAVDNCSEILNIIQSPVVGYEVPAAGILSVEIRVEDEYKNRSMCYVNIYHKDTIKPEVISSPDTVYGSPTSVCSFKVPDYSSLITAEDNCSGTLLYEQHPNASEVIYSDTDILLVIKDETGNTVSRMMKLIFTDEIPPSIECDTTFVLPVDNLCEAAIVPYLGQGVKVDDNCSGVIEIEQSIIPGSFLNATTEITFSAIDNKGNSSQCVTTIEIADKTAPQVNCFTEQVLVLDKNCEAFLADYTAALQAEDNCSRVVGTKQFPAPNTVFTQPGKIMVTVLSTDASNNTDTCLFFVRLEAGKNSFCFGETLITTLVTPNGDGKNDAWLVKGFDRNVEVKIYTRLGKLVYQNRSYSSDWKGMSGGSILPNGTYYYSIALGGRITNSGALTLMR